MANLKNMWLLVFQDCFLKGGFCSSKKVNESCVVSR